VTIPRDVHIVEADEGDILRYGEAGLSNRLLAPIAVMLFDGEHGRRPWL